MLNQKAKTIKQELKRKSGINWSVTVKGDSIVILAPKARRVVHRPEFEGQYRENWADCQPPKGTEGFYTSKADQALLANLLGIDPSQSLPNGVWL